MAAGSGSGAHHPGARGRGPVAGSGQGWWWAGREEGFLEEYLEVMGMNLDMAEFGFCSLANLLIKFDLQC